MGNRPALLRERYRILWPFEKHRGKEAGADLESCLINIERRSMQGRDFAVGQFRAEANHASWNNWQIVGKIFSAHARGFMAQDIFRPEQSLSDIGRKRRDLFIVDHPR